MLGARIYSGFTTQPRTARLARITWTCLVHQSRRPAAPSTLVLQPLHRRASAALELGSETLLGQDYQSDSIAGHHAYPVTPPPFPLLVSFLVQHHDDLIPMYYCLCFYCTNNMVEYEVLILGLKAAIFIMVKSIQIFNNSQSIMK